MSRLRQPEQIRSVADGCLAFIAGSVPFILYHAIKKLWWTYDDFFLLRYAISHHPGEYLFNPRIWQQIPNLLFTPILLLSYDTDIFFWGIDTSRFYLHHLLELCLLGAALYLLMRLWVSRASALVCAAVTVAGAPFGTWALQLMDRHYVESSVALCAALFAFVVAIRRDAMFFDLLSAGAYFVAACAKEIAVPLPLLLLLLPETTIRTRARALMPHAAALAMYVAWRRYMLGEFFGGYGFVLERGDVPELIGRLPHDVYDHLFAGSSLGIIALAVAMALAAPLLGDARRAVFASAGLACIVGPILPVAQHMDDRYVVLLWVYVIVAAAIGWQTEFWRRHALVALILAGVLIASVAVIHRRAWPQMFAASKRMSVEARYYVTMTPGQILRNPTVPPAAMGELEWFKEQILHGPAGAGWTYDDLFFCTHTPAEVFEFERNAVVRVTGAVRAGAARKCPAYVVAAPLSIHLSYADGVLSWTFGPRHDGQYRFVFADGVQAFDVPWKAKFVVRGMPGIAARVRYTAPNGQVEYSPLLTMDFARNKQVWWPPRVSLRGGAMIGTTEHARVD